MIPSLMIGPTRTSRANVLAGLGARRIV